MAVESITISDAITGASARILVGFGLNCYQFQAVSDDGPVDVIWSDPGFASGEKSPSGSGFPILFPFPGRIRGTSLGWRGREYTLEEGDGLGNAIHGFVHRRRWQVIEQSPGRIKGRFQASVDAPEILQSWPADFRLTVTFEIIGNMLDATFEVENPSDRPLPCGLGTHPYFRVPLGPDGSAADCLITVPVTQQWELVNMIATGKKLPVEDAVAYRQGLRFADTSFDNVFSGLRFEGDRCTAGITDPARGRRVTISFDREFRECVVYNPPHRKAICIEPYTCVPDAVRLSEQGVDAGLRVLEPNEAFTARVTIQVQ